MATRSAKHEKKTRRVKRKTLSIPQLRSAFDHVERRAEELRGADKKTQVHEFQKTWKQLFGREIDAKAADAYLSVKHKTKKRSATRRRSQRGGAAGAPLDFQTRPGIDGVHGSFPAYMTDGLKGYDSINQIAMKADCGVKDFTPKLPPTMGSNQAGGAAMQAILSVPAPTGGPSMFQDFRSFMLGKDMPPSPAPEDPAWHFKGHLATK